MKFELVPPIVLPVTPILANINATVSSIVPDVPPVLIQNPAITNDIAPFRAQFRGRITFSPIMSEFPGICAQVTPIGIDVPSI